ncbi:uncharacterized protein LOC128736247 [Sabethes cyaneus]|uniref:uncharacterized protein LOC128736247 n=1 Tax=Sabethes cyaneus TaxID=53552 RepID=UPI00237D6199|nr:uncharacterized protein LOC128736247 [Sabethes cyaneus]
MDVAKHCAKCDRPDTADNLVGCDTCETWMHYGCAQVTDSIAEENRSWKCDQCRDAETSQSRVSFGRSASSKRSSRLDLSLKMIEEQKEMEKRRILEEEAAQAAARKKLAETEEKFMKKKYELLLIEADDSEGAETRSRLSSRAEREKVKTWLSEQEVGTAHRVKVVSSSCIPQTSAASEIAQQSTAPASSVLNRIVPHVAVVEPPAPMSASTPNSVEGSRNKEHPVAATVSQSAIPVRSSGDFVSHTEITLDIPRRPPVSSSLTRCNSSIRINSCVPMDAGRINRSAPPSIVESHPAHSRGHLPEPIVNNIPINISQTSGCVDIAVVCQSSRGPMLHDSIVGTSAPVVSTINHMYPPMSNYNTTFSTVSSTLSQQCLTNGSVQIVNSSSAYNSIAVPQYGVINSGGLVDGYPQSLQNSVPFVTMQASRPVFNSGCQSTWVNNNITSARVGGTSSGIQSVPIVSSHGEGIFANCGGVSRFANQLVPSAFITAPHQVGSQASQAWPGQSSFYTQSQSKPQQQQSAASVRSGPSSEQIAARQVMPRELPNFSGDPQDWPLFYSSFYNSTVACGYTDSENLARLQRCLKGNALEAVRTRLLMPDSVPFVIDTLKRLYGRPEILIHSLLQKLRAAPAPKTDNLQSQINFGLAVQNVVDHMSIANLTDHLRNPTLLHELVEKLPPQIKMQWSYYKNKCASVNLTAFSAFMSELMVMASDVTLPMDALALSSKPGRSGKEKPKLYVHSDEHRERKTVAAEQHLAQTERAKKACIYCANEHHEIASCKQFKALDIDGRWKVVKQKNLCRSCLVPHRKWPCRTRKECGVNGCRIHHHILLHSPNSSADTSNGSGNASTVVHQNLHRSTSYSLFRYLPVTIYGNGKQVSTYAFLDEGSSSTLLEHSIALALGIKGPPDGFCLSWTGNISREEKESERVSVVICGDGKQFKLHNVRTVQQLQLPAQTMCYEDLARTYHHLKGLPVRSYTDAIPGIIIGIEHIRLLTALRTREGRDNEPVATKTRLGWCVFGKSSNNGDGMQQLNLHLVSEVSNRELHQLMKQFFTVEESSVTVKPESEEDRRARRIMEATTRRVDNHYEIGLLWRYDKLCFPNSYPMALRRLQALEKRLSKDPVLDAKVREKIMEYEAKGYAHRITPEEQSSTDPSKVWYLPLGVVQNPKKPNKLRLIWDAKARVGGTSFNDMLLKGPDLLVSLMEVLLRFRQGNIAVVGDIKEMFHQIRIRDDDKQAQRFIFRQSPETEPQEYVMDVATFGASCSPSLAQFIKNKNASEFAGAFSRAAKAITQNHYVDDLLDSVDTEEEAILLVNEVKHIHLQAGFEIRNFCSNSVGVLASIGEPVARRQISMNLEKSPESERVLGLIWKLTEDVFTFDINSMKEEIKTLIHSGATPSKRQVLQTVMSLFDPLGLIAHLVVHGKILMQQIWRTGTEWDELIAEELWDDWRLWCQCLQRLDEVKVPRCFFKGVGITTLKDAEAHLFVDASEMACASVLYLRFMDNGKPRCVLVAAKTKVAPLKPLSIPRLELQAAMIGTRLMDSVLNALDIQITKRFLWTDSTTVLCWLRSDSRRYHQFVAFRKNVADVATKWKDGPSFDPNHPWYNAPEFVYQAQDQWPSEPLQSQAETETELRAVFLFHGTVPYELLEMSRFSKWNRLLRATAYVLRAVRRFKGEKPVKPNHLTQGELYNAENLIWRQVQAGTYPDEYANLRRNLANPASPSQIPKNSPLYRLSVFLDERGVVRMNSRISTAPSVPYDMQFPIVLPRKHPAIRLLTEDYHRRFLHSNGETVCNEMRQRFLVPGLRILIRQVAKQCVTCRVRKAVPAPPMMSALPKVRVTGMVRPFTHTGVDYLGPIQIKQGRSLVKRWVALFTCLAIRAVRLEVVHSLSTQSCVMAIRRFVARRGSPETFHSDNGTNFVGASNLLANQVQNIHEDCAVTFTNGETSWLFNPPSTPHMGGCWERMVRSVKSAISAIADHPRHPCDEVFETVVIEAESIINSRPLTYIPLESAEQESLTPNHFLLFGTKGITQPGIPIKAEENSLRDSWRLAQYLVDHFWTRWVREYLPTITKRTKWFEPVKPLKTGDLVLVVEDSKRNGWLRGRIVDVIKAADGQVRRAVVQTKNGMLNRPAVKLALLDIQLPVDGPELHGQGDVTKRLGGFAQCEFGTARNSHSDGT